MKIVLCLFALLALAVVYQLRNRTTSLWLIAWLSAVAYFLPGFDPSVSYSVEVMAIYCAFFFVLTVGCLFSARHTARHQVPPDVERDRVAANILLLMSLALLAIQVQQEGIAELFFTHKGSRSVDGRAFAAWTATVGLGFVLCVAHRWWKATLLFGVQLFLHLLMGDRTLPVLAILSLIVIVHEGRATIAASTKAGLTISRLGASLLLVLTLGVFGKSIYGALADTTITGRSYLEALEVRVTGIESVRQTLEPYHTQSILQHVVSNDFVLDPSYLWSAPLFAFPVSLPANYELHHFSETVKTAYYYAPREIGGIAGNFWAEGYAVGGWLGLAIYLLIFALVLIVFDRWSRRATGFAKAAAVLCGATWAFYIHRNAMFQIISHEKKYLYAFLFVLLVATVVRFVMHGRRSRFPRQTRPPKVIAISGCR
jgi:hypothetical protein